MRQGVETGRNPVARAGEGVVESGASGTASAPPQAMSPFIASLSPHLFWDVDREQVDLHLAVEALA